MATDLEKRMIAGLIVPRLDGENIESNLDHYLKLARQGIGGFIVFGGEKEALAGGLAELRRAAERPLLIMSDLEQGLGQHVAGGTTFPPAMAVAHAVDLEKGDDLDLFGNMIEIIAGESLAAGINTILAPVADIHTNPENPIICTRAFGRDPAAVSSFVGEYIRRLQRTGIAACAKHFPGHGDTDRDSHVELPALRHDMDRLQRVELRPFRRAVREGVSMLMVGHLRVDAIDHRAPATLSAEVVDGLIRQELGFEGVVITDAMNMGAIREEYGEEEACLMALRAGCDILLHPENPEGVISMIGGKRGQAGPRIAEADERVRKLLSRLSPYAGANFNSAGSPDRPRAAQFRPDELVGILSEKALRVEKGRAGLTGKEIVVIIDEDGADSGAVFSETLKARHPRLSVVRPPVSGTASMPHSRGRPLVAALFSRVAGWKGRSGLSPDNRELLKEMLGPASETTLISFGCPSLHAGLEADNLINAWWAGDAAQKAVVRLLCGKSCL